MGSTPFRRTDFEKMNLERWVNQFRRHYYVSQFVYYDHYHSCVWYEKIWIGLRWLFAEMNSPLWGLKKSVKLSLMIKATFLTNFIHIQKIIPEGRQMNFMTWINWSKMIVTFGLTIYLSMNTFKSIMVW